MPGGISPLSWGHFRASCRQPVDVAKDICVAQFLPKGALGGTSMKMTTTMTLSVICTALLFSTGSLSAHHSVVAEFNLNQPVTVTGTLTKIEWVNPHGW